MSIQLLDFSNFKEILSETEQSYAGLTTPEHLEIQAHDFYLVRVSIQGAPDKTPTHWWSFKYKCTEAFSKATLVILLVAFLTVVDVLVRHILNEKKITEGSLKEAATVA